ncbi:MAG: hypothetical protein AB7K71_04640 [Polyangiaceae bacterium]
MRWLALVPLLFALGCGGSAAGEPATPESEGKPAPEVDRLYEQLASCTTATSNAGITLKCQGFAIQLGQVVVEQSITDELLRETESIAISGVEKSWGIPVERVPMNLSGVPATGFPPPDASHPGGLAVSTAVAASKVLITMCLGPPCPRLMGDAPAFFQAMDRFLDEHPPAPAG